MLARQVEDPSLSPVKFVEIIVNSQRTSFNVNEQEVSVNTLTEQLIDLSLQEYNCVTMGRGTLVCVVMDVDQSGLLINYCPVYVTTLDTSGNMMYTL
ncbi:hypothetical protein J6590_096280 [Homalodisca vitripennis]|nr:hypothetical protein J6590_072589 [Homalodisca vitripennis]KAG8309005.1 hypothetical protein J6590_096280 [Homalodisca vitripennis]